MSMIARLRTTARTLGLRLLAWSTGSAWVDFGDLRRVSARRFPSPTSLLAFIAKWRLQLAADLNYGAYARIELAMSETQIDLSDDEKAVDQIERCPEPERRRVEIRLFAAPQAGGHLIAQLWFQNRRESPILQRWHPADDTTGTINVVVLEDLIDLYTEPVPDRGRRRTPVAVRVASDPPPPPRWHVARVVVRVVLAALAFVGLVIGIGAGIVEIIAFFASRP